MFTTLAGELRWQRLRWSAIYLYSKSEKNRSLSHPLGHLGVTYTLHLWLVGKPVVDFIIVVIELGWLRLGLELGIRLGLGIVRCLQVDYAHNRRVLNKRDDRPWSNFVNSWQAAVKECIVADLREWGRWQMWLRLRVSNDEYDSVQKLDFAVNTTDSFNHSDSSPPVLACFAHRLDSLFQSSTT